MDFDKVIKRRIISKEVSYQKKYHIRILEIAWE
jgi:hypothetical protein